MKEAKPVSKSLERLLLSSMSSLGIALVIERGAGFLGNVFAARVASSQTFGAYSLGVTTAMNVAIYAGAGIGSTASRFVGKYRPGSINYPRFVRALTIVCCASALLAMGILWLFSGFLAVKLLHNAALTTVLRASALFAGAFILLECYRGLLIGQRSSALLVVLSTLAGLGLVIAVPLAAHIGPEAMLVSQSAAIVLAVGATVVLLMRQQPPSDLRAAEEGDAPEPSILNLWRFGLVQLGGVIGLNAAGWWTASLVASADHSLLQMALYSISGQLRNIVALVPSLVAQSGLSLMTEETSTEFGGATRVLGISTLFAQGLAITASGLGVAVLPWVLHLLYGTRYLNADLAGSLAIATALIHTSSSPGATRLVVLSLRATGFINLVWALFVIAASAWAVPRGGAAGGIAVMLSAHVLSMVLVLIVLHRKKELGPAVAPMSAISIGTALALSAITWFRSTGGTGVPFAFLLCLLVTGVALLLLTRKARSRELMTGLNATPLFRQFAVFARK